MGINGLDFQTVPIAFTKGMNTKTQPKLAVPGEWDTLENLSLAENGTPRLRDAWRPLVAAQNGNGLATHNDQLLTINGPTVASISTGGTDQAVTVSGMPGYVGIAKHEVRRSTGMQDTPDCATGGGYTCYVWREKDAANAVVGINCTLVDETTGTPMLSNVSLRANVAVFGARVVFANSAFFIFYIQGTSLYCTVVTAAAPTTLGTEVALITSANLAGLNFDAASYGPNSGVMVTYAWADGVTSVRTIEVTRTGTVPSINTGPTNLITEANVNAASITAVACLGFASNTNALAVVLASAANAGAYAAGGAAVINAAFALVVAGTAGLAESTTTSAAGLCMAQDSTRIRVFRDFRSEWGTNALNQIVSIVVDTALVTFAGPTNVIPTATFGAGVNARGPQGPFVHGKPFVSGSRVFLPVFVAGVYTNLALATSNPRTQNTQNTFFVLDTGATGTNIAAGVVVAKALYGSYGLATFNGTAPTVGTPCSSPEVSTGNFATVSGELTRLVLTSGINISPTGLVRLTMSPSSSVPPVRAQLGESTYLAGGSLAAFDGDEVVEHGFPLFPEGVAITVLGAGGAMTAGVHQVCFIYEWVDNAGQRHQSAPSPVIQVTAVANDSLSCQVPTLLLSQKTGIEIVAFMTQAGGLTFNRVVLNNGIYDPEPNLTTANIVTYLIDDADATIAGNELLYTQPNKAGTTLANVAPGPVNHLAIAHNRLWYDKADQPGAFGFSQEYINNLGLQFSPDLGGLVPLDSGDSAGVAALDEKVILFRERKLFVVYGTGPTPSGGYNNYSDPQEIPSDVGCSEARSIVRIPQGLMFKSQKGWYLLGRDLTTRYIGEGVALYDGNSVSSACMLEDRQEARFTSTSGVHFSYCYLHNEWSILQRATTAYAIADSIWWPVLAAWVHISTTSGLNYDRDPSVVGLTVDQCGSDTARAIQWRGRTSWLKLAALEGYQRVRWLYLTMTAIDMPSTTLNIAVDYDDLPSAGAAGAYNFNIVFSSITGLNVNSIDVRHKLRRMKCKSVRFTFTQVCDSSECLNGLQAMALQLGMKRGVNRLRAAQSVG